MSWQAHILIVRGFPHSDFWEEIDLKYLRIVLLYILFFFVALIPGGIFLQQFGDGALVLFAFVAPGLMVWWFEKRRARRLALKQAKQPDPIAARRGPSPPIADNHATAKRRLWETHRRTAPAAINKTTTQADRSEGRSSRRQGWVPRGEVVFIHGREIPGMVYVGTPPSVNTSGYGEKCRAYIDPALPVARDGNDKDGKGMPYWPGYSSISPECRATYLDWLAARARDGAYSPGYMFLYFYGLERRFFVEDPPIDERRNRAYPVNADSHYL